MKFQHLLLMAALASTSAARSVIGEITITPEQLEQIVKDQNFDIDPASFPALASRAIQERHNNLNILVFESSLRSHTESHADGVSLLFLTISASYSM